MNAEKVLDEFPLITSFLDANEKLTDDASICLVTPDLTGLVKNGGIGAACHHTAVQMARSGLDVTILFTAPAQFIDADEVIHAQAHYAKEQVRLVILTDEFADDVNVPTFPSDNFVRLSYYTYEWLKGETFDEVMFTDWHTTGYYCMLAKKQGLAFRNTCLSVQIHSPSTWGLYFNKSLSSSVADVRSFHMERETIENADFITCPTQYLLKWVRDHGFKLPEQSFIQPYLLSWPEVTETRTYAANEIQEIVFFGRLEERKGIHIFCNALDVLAEKGGVPDSLKVTFLGNPVQIARENSVDYIIRRKKNWPWQTEIVTGRGTNEALDYLKAETRVAVICPTEDNSPLVVHECMYNRIPFIASVAGGIPEIVGAQEDGRTILFEPDRFSLAAKLQEISSVGLSTVLPATNQTRNTQLWHDAFAAKAQNQRSVQWEEVLEPDAAPAISICLTHYNRPELLGQALESLRNQTFQNFEVVLVDDGSTDPAAIEYLGELESEFRRRNWQIIHQENQYPSAARNNAARQARGTYLLFMDDDNYAKPHELQTFFDAMNFSGADVLTCFADLFQSESAPNAATPVVTRCLPLGNPLNLAFFENAFGDTNFMVKRDKFIESGGFTVEYGIGYEDFEILCSMVAKGFDVRVLPESLFWYRRWEESINTSTSIEKNMYRVFRPVFESIQDNPFRDSLMYLFGHALSLANNSSTIAGADYAINLTDSVLSKLHHSGVETFVVYGAGIHTTKIAAALTSAEVKLVGVVDDNPQLHGGKMLDVPILSLADTKAAGPGAVLISSDTIEGVLYQKAVRFFADTSIPVLRLYACTSNQGVK